MNQLVPQLFLGSALDAWSGPPEYHPYWRTHQTDRKNAQFYIADCNNKSHDHLAIQIPPPGASSAKLNVV
jgi:hypothetical protein